jgi:hypothetical protein
MKGRPSDISFAMTSSARDAKLRIDQTLVRHVVDELRIEVPVEIADPLFIRARLRASSGVSLGPGKTSST